MDKGLASLLPGCQQRLGEGGCGEGSARGGRATPPSPPHKPARRLRKLGTALMNAGLQGPPPTPAR